MEDLPKVTEHLEYIFLMKMAAGLKSNEVDIPTAKNLAQTFLKIEPFTSLEDAKTKINEFAKQHTLLSSLTDFIDGYYYEHHKDDTLEQMRTHIKAGNIDEALKVVQQ